MKTKFQYLILVSLVLILEFFMSSCGINPQGHSPIISEKETQTTNSGETVENTSEADNDVQVAYTFENVQDAYPSKTVLVWCLPDFYRTGLEVNVKVNEYLDLLGKDYVVYFKILPYTSDDGDYVNLMKIKIANGEPMDILYSAEIAEDSTMTFSYHSYVLEGFYEPLDEYFTNTEIGRKLYNQMPENYWHLLLVDGKIYAADGSSGNYSYPSGYCVNKKLAEKYGFDITKPISEQLDILEAVKKNESDCDIVFYPAKMGNSAYYSEVFESLNGIVYDYDSDSLIRLTDDESFLERLSEINALARAGYVNSSNNMKAKNFFISFAAADALTVDEVGSEALKYYYDDTPTEVINVYSKSKMSFKVPNTATGVCSCSQNKDMAFDLLATVMTDGYLNDLLAGGEGGLFSVVFSDKFKNEAVSSIAENNKSEDYNELYLSALKEAELPPFIGFCFDVYPVAKEYVKVRSVLMSYDFAQDEEVDRILEDVNKKLDEAGINAVLNEANRQYHDWRDNQ